MPQMSKDETIRFRCDAELRRRFEEIAKAKRRTPADLARLVLEDFIATEENSLKETPAPVQNVAGNRTEIKPYGLIKRK
jgi:predicted transcriptional regulator